MLKLRLPFRLENCLLFNLLEQNSEQNSLRLSSVLLSGALAGRKHRL
jgi:hypothetical protein